MDEILRPGVVVERTAQKEQGSHIGTRGSISSQELRAQQKERRMAEIKALAEAMGKMPNSRREAKRWSRKLRGVHDQDPDRTLDRDGLGYYHFVRNKAGEKYTSALIRNERNGNDVDHDPSSQHRDQLQQDWKQYDLEQDWKKYRVVDSDDEPEPTPPKPEFVTDDTLPTSEYFRIREEELGAIQQTREGSENYSDQKPLLTEDDFPEADSSQHYYPRPFIPKHTEDRRPLTKAERYRLMNGIDETQFKPGILDLLRSKSRDAAMKRKITGVQEHGSRGNSRIDEVRLADDEEHERIKARNFRKHVREAMYNPPEGFGEDTQSFPEKYREASSDENLAWADWKAGDRFEDAAANDGVFDSNFDKYFNARVADPQEIVKKLLNIDITFDEIPISLRDAVLAELAKRYAQHSISKDQWENLDTDLQNELIQRKARQLKIYTTPGQSRKSVRHVRG